MAVKILHKRSAVQFKSATGAQLEFGELGLNYHESGPYLQCKDAAGEVVQLGGVYIGDSAPGNELKGAWWLRSADETLFLYDGTKWVSIAGGGGGGGGTTTVIGGDGIEAVLSSADTYTVSVDLATNSNGLSIVGGKLTADIATTSSLGTVKIGDGIDVDASGEISVDLSGLDVNADLEYVPDGNNAAEITNTAGDNATVPIAIQADSDATPTPTVGVAGLFTGLEKEKLAGIEDGAQVNGAPVTISETAPADPADGDLWWADSDVDDGGGRLYTWTGDEWVDVSIPGGALTQADGDIRYLSRTSNDTAAGAITFKGLTTHEDGVSVTGGTGAVENGLTYRSGDGGVRIIAGSTSSLVVKKDSIETRANLDGSGGALDIQGVKNVLMAVDDDTAPGQHIYSYNQLARNIAGADDKFKQVKGFDIPDGAIKGPVADVAGNKGYAFYSDVGTATNAELYNFYAAGSAPNYFAGSLKIASDPGIQVNSGTGVMLTPNGATFGKTDDTTNSSCTTFTRRVATGTAENTQARILTFRGQSSNIATIRFDGSGGVTNVISTSDYRVKENVVDMPSAVEAIKALRPVEFNFINSPGKTTKGFIAHELQAVEPLAAFGTKDATEAIGTLTDWDGTELETEVIEPSAEELTYTEEVETDGVATMVTRTRSWSATGTRDVYQGVDQTKLIPLLTKALQEVMQKNEDLEARIAALEGA